MANIVGFNDLKQDERVIAVIRHHWFVYVRELIGIGIVFILPFFVLPFAFASTGGVIPLPSIAPGVIVFFSSLWALAMWHAAFARWTDYYFDIWIITNHRVIDIDQKGFFARNVATLLTLNHIQDMEADVSGVISSILNYGHVKIQTAAAKSEFTIDEVPNPAGVERLIRAAIDENKRVFGVHA